MSIQNFRATASIITAAMLFSSDPAQASYPVSSGQVSNLYVAQGGNYGFRVYLAGVPTMCTGGGPFAYSNVSDDNYKVYVSTLSMAYMLGKPVTITMEVIGGQCHILEVGM